MTPEEFIQKEYGNAKSISREQLLRLLKHFARVLSEIKTKDEQESIKKNRPQTPPLQQTAIKRSCIDFAEWILKEGFEKYQDNGKCWWGRFREEKDYSTEQLYKMWRNYA